MSTWKRWTRMAVAAAVVGLAAPAVATAQEPAPPRDGKALAQQLGLSSETAAKLMPRLNELTQAMARERQLREQAAKLHTDLRGAFGTVLPELSPGQRQQLMGMMWRGGMRGYGAGGRAGHGMGPGYGMGPGSRYGMGPGQRMGPGYGMHRGMGYPMGPGAAGMGPANCPYLNTPRSAPQGGDSTSSGGAPRDR